MKIPNWQHHSKKDQKRKLKPQALRQAKARRQALKKHLNRDASFFINIHILILKKMDNRDIFNFYEAYTKIYDEIDEAKVDDNETSTMKMVNRNVRNNAGRSSRRSLNKIYRGHNKRGLDIPARDMSPTPHGKTDEGKGRYWTKMIAKQRSKNEEVDIYDIVLSHLLDEGYVETPEAAERIMVNMSEEWIESIVEEVLDESRGGFAAGLNEPAPKSFHKLSRGSKMKKGLKTSYDTQGNMVRKYYTKQLERRKQPPYND